MFGFQIGDVEHERGMAFHILSADVPRCEEANSLLLAARTVREFAVNNSGGAATAAENIKYVMEGRYEADPQSKEVVDDYFVGLGFVSQAALREHEAYSTYVRIIQLAMGCREE